MFEMKPQPFVQDAMDGFAEVGRLAVLQELKIRLLADKTEAIKETSQARSASAPTNAVIDHFAKQNMLTPDEGKLIESTREIRNKIFHCDFLDAMILIERLIGEPLKPSGIRVLQFKSGVALTDEAPKCIRNIPKDEAGIFGPLIQMHSSNGFKLAAKKFEDAIRIIDRVINEAGRQDFEKGSKL